MIWQEKTGIEEYGKQVFMYLQTKIHIYREEELHNSPEQLGGFDLLEEALESTLQTALDPHWKLIKILQSEGRK
jgi:hypothetical protein